MAPGAGMELWLPQDLEGGAKRPVGGSRANKQGLRTRLESVQGGASGYLGGFEALMSGPGLSRGLLGDSIKN